MNIMYCLWQGGEAEQGPGMATSSSSLALSSPLCHPAPVGHSSEGRPGAELAPRWPRLRLSRCRALRLLLRSLWDSELEATGGFGCVVGKGLEQMRAVWRLGVLHESAGSPSTRGDSQLPSSYGSKRAGSGPAAPDCFSLQLPWKPPGRRFYFPGAAVPSAACQVGRWLVVCRVAKKGRQIDKYRNVRLFPSCQCQGLESGRLCCDPGRGLSATPARGL